VAGAGPYHATASTDQTAGYEVFHQYGPEGTGPGPRHHPWDESFFVLAGEVACGIDGVGSVASPDTFVHIPGGVTHWYRFGTGGGELVSMTSKGEASRMYETFDRQGSWASPDRAKLAELAARPGQIVVNPYLAQPDRRTQSTLRI
jgi:mannose-6-phosphate isomerase-like protein (cupin superfamily)